MAALLASTASARALSELSPGRLYYALVASPLLSSAACDATLPIFSFASELWLGGQFFIPSSTLHSGNTASREA